MLWRRGGTVAGRCSAGGEKSRLAGGPELALSRTAAASPPVSTTVPSSLAKQPLATCIERPTSVGRGRELREALTKVASLYVHHKSTQAKEAMAAIPPGPSAGDGLAKVRAGELRSLLFTVGGLTPEASIIRRSGHSAFLRHARSVARRTSTPSIWSNARESRRQCS